MRDGNQNSNRTPARSNEQYKVLLDLWIGGVGHYHNLSTGYLTANSILTTATVLLLDNFVGSNDLMIFVVIAIFSIVGIVICIQMSMALKILRTKNAYLERSLRVLEEKEGQNDQVFRKWHEFKEGKVHFFQSEGSEGQFWSNYAIKHHKNFWASRMKMLPWLFGVLYVIFTIFGVLSYFSFF